MAVLSWWSDLSLLDCGNERDLCMLNSFAYLRIFAKLLRWTFGVKPTEVRGNNRSVMPLDVLGRTRATLTHTTSNSSPERPAGNQQYAS